MSEESVDPETGLQVLVKQPGESRRYTMDFTNLLVDGRLSGILDVTSVKQDKVQSSSNITIEGAGIAGSSIRFRIPDGDDGENYKITAQVEDSRGNILEGEGMLYVRDR